MSRNRAGGPDNLGSPPSSTLTTATTLGGPVLLVESDAALRRVIALGLRGRGLDVVETGALGDIWERIITPPAAIVLDVGLGASSEWMLLRALGGHHALRAAPLVLLAWECPAALDPIAPERGESRRERVCLTKPFDARALFAAVERLVATPAQTAPVATAVGMGLSTSPALAEAAMHMDIERRPAAGASVWPLVAAGAATLAVAGFLIHPALSVVGVMLLIAAVLWWSTTTEPATPA